MSETITAPAAPAAVLDDTWLELVINGQSVRVEAFEANEVLAGLEAKFQDSANECLDCGAICGYAKVCPACKSERLRATKAFRDSLADGLTRFLGIPAVSGRLAMQIASRIAEAVESKKNASSTTPALPGGTASTPRHSRTAKRKHGSR